MTKLALSVIGVVLFGSGYFVGGHENRVARDQSSDLVTTEVTNGEELSKERPIVDQNDGPAAVSDKKGPRLSQPQGSPHSRWKDWDLRQMQKLQQELQDENLSLTALEYAPVENAAEAGDAAAAFRLFLLHKSCSHAANTTEEDIQRRENLLGAHSSEADQQLVIDMAERFYRCQQFDGNHKIRAYHFLSLAAQYRYPPATLRFLEDSRRLIEDQLYRYPELVTEHLIRRESVIQEAAVSCNAMVLIQLSMEFSYRGTLGTDLEKRYLYTYLANLAAKEASMKATTEIMAGGAETLFTPTVAQSLREKAEALYDQSCLG